MSTQVCREVDDKVGDVGFQGEPPLRRNFTLLNPTGSGIDDRKQSVQE